MKKAENEDVIAEEELVRQALEAVDGGSLARGLELMEMLPPTSRSPVVQSYLACCLAGEHGSIEEAKSMCLSAMERDPLNPVHYLNLGRVFLLQGDKKEAIRQFRDGLLYGDNRLIRKELDRLGRRDPPIFLSLGRENPLNRICGKIRKKLRSRG